MEKYSYEDVYNSTMKYFKGDTLATDVWIKKYCLKDSDGNYYEKTPDDMHKRLAKEFANIENDYNNIQIDNLNSLSIYGQKREKLTYEEIYEYFKEFNHIIPQGSVMSVLGNPFVVGSLSNCIVLPEIFDSYGGIMYTDQQLTHLYKRRCVSDESYVKIKEKGLIKIKDVNIGDHILCNDNNNNIDEYCKVLDKFNTVVSEDDRLNIILSNGTQLKTSKKHPVLTFNDNGYEYINSEFLKINDVLIKPQLNIFNSYSEDNNINDISWFIGHHLGDGNSGWITNIDNRHIKQHIYKKIRIRILSNSEECVQNYERVHKLISKSKTSTHLSKRKDYKSKVWEYYSTLNENENIVDKYFDNQIGNKTYNSYIPSFIKNNNTWIPFLAGLIDADGTMKDNKTIVISLANKNLIDEITSYISSLGLIYHTNQYKHKKRPNESISYRLSIKYNKDFYNKIEKFIIHKEKKRKITKYNL
jgi:hypothetical protein